MLSEKGVTGPLSFGENEMAERGSRCDARRAAAKAHVLIKLAEHGTATATCRAAGVNQETMRNWRRSDAAFAENWAATMAAFETARLRRLAGDTDPPGGKKWSPKRQDQFLDVLAATGCQAEALRAVGMTHTSLWRLARRNPAFRAAMHAALDQVYTQVELGVLDEARNGVAPRPTGARAPASESLRGKVYAQVQKRGANFRATAIDEAERDRNEALAAKWVTKMLGIIRNGR